MEPRTIKSAAEFAVAVAPGAAEHASTASEGTGAAGAPREIEQEHAGDDLQQSDRGPGATPQAQLGSREARTHRAALCVSEHERGDAPAVAASEGAQHDPAPP